MNLILEAKEKALQIVRNRGPLLPVQITKDLGVNVIMAGALLSELVDNGTLKITKLKVGGSPMYYVTGQEPKLQALRDKLNDKQQKAFDMLKQSTVLQDTKQEAVIRQSLRDMKDFAFPLQVTAGAVNEIFWKWYLTSNEEAEPIIKEQLGALLKEEKKPEPKPIHQEMEKELQKLEQDLKKLEKPIEQKVKEELSKEPQKIKKERKVQKPIQEVHQEPVQEQVDEDDTFMKTVLAYFTQNSISSKDLKQVRRDSDFECHISIPTAVGSVNYFCKAKNKQKISDADLSLLFVQAQMKKMPVLLITTGDLTKKAQDLLKTEFKTITVKKI